MKFLQESKSRNHRSRGSVFSRKEMTLDGTGLGVRLPQTLQLFGGPGGLGGTGAAGVGGEGSRPGASAKLAVGPAPLPHISVCVL